MRVQLLPALAEQLLNSGHAPQTLVEAFSDWKAAGEDDHYLFARDALNRGSKWLRHVHIVPLNNVEALEHWDAAWSRYRKRTSDRYLFYVDGGSLYGFLLLHIVDDPGAHRFLSTPTKAEQQLLNVFEHIADKFVHYGTI